MNLRVCMFVCCCYVPQSGYELLYTPHMANVGLWNTSGHTEFYRDSMFRAIEVEEEHYMVKPMNCPFHCLVYKVRALD